MHMYVTYLFNHALSTCTSDVVVIGYIRIPCIIGSDNRVPKKFWEHRSFYHELFGWLVIREEL